AERVNATLPLDKPDVVLLALVQNQRDIGCSASCPEGQQLGADRRCIPTPIVAHAARSAPRREVRLRPAPIPASGEGVIVARSSAPAAAAGPPGVPTGSHVPRATLEGRMSMGGPRVTLDPAKNPGGELAVAPAPDQLAEGVLPSRERRSARYHGHRLARGAPRALRPRRSAP